MLRVPSAPSQSIGHLELCSDGIGGGGESIPTGRIVVCSQLLLVFGARSMAIFVAVLFASSLWLLSDLFCSFCSTGRGSTEIHRLNHRRNRLLVPAEIPVAAHCWCFFVVVAVVVVVVGWLLSSRSEIDRCRIDRLCVRMCGTMTTVDLLRPLDDSPLAWPGAQNIDASLASQSTSQLSLRFHSDRTCSPCSSPSSVTPLSGSMCIRH